MIRDPLQEVLAAAEGTPDEATAAELDPSDVATLALARRRFGVALPPPFAALPAEPAGLPLRPGAHGDGAAVAAVERRAWRDRYRGVVSDSFLDDLDLSYLGRYWIGRTSISPSAQHRLIVAGRPGEVHGSVDTGPTRDEDGPVDADGRRLTGEVRSLHVDPTVMGAGLGSALLAGAEAALDANGFTAATLWVIEGNERGRGFYARWGWEADGPAKVVMIGSEALPHVRYRLTRALGAV